MFKPDAAGRAFFQYWRERMRIQGKPTVMRMIDAGALRLVVHGWRRPQPDRPFFRDPVAAPGMWELDLGRIEIRWGTHWRRRRIGVSA